MNSLILLAGMFGGVFGQSVWTTRTSGTTSQLLSIAASGTQRVIVGSEGTILTSLNGIDWLSQNSGRPNLLSSVTWTGTQWIAVGNSDLLTGYKKSVLSKQQDFFYGILTSPDGITWASPWTGLGNTNFSSVCSKLVVVGNATVMTSPNDGVNWQSRFFSGLTSYYLKSVIWTGSQLVAVGYKATGTTSDLPPKAGIFTSSDGVGWTQRNADTTRMLLNSVAWTGSRLVATGYRVLGDTTESRSGVVLTSSDGISWTSKNVALASRMKSIIWTGQQLVAVGDSGTILTSSNGIDWTQKNPGVSTHLRAVAWDGSKIIVVGDGGTILTSPQEPVSITPNFSAQDNLPFRLESNQLFATLPSSFLGTNVRASIFTVKGNKVREVNAGNSATGIVMPLGKLTNGIYLFELQTKNRRMTRTFSLMR